MLETRRAVGILLIRDHTYNYLAIADQQKMSVKSASRTLFSIYPNISI